APPQRPLGGDQCDVGRARVRSAVGRPGAALDTAAALALAALCTIAPPIAAQTADPLTVVPDRGIVAFTDITVIPMDRERTLPTQTVVVENGRITAMGPTATTRVPSGATRVPGQGKFLMPGLTDMHAHAQGGAGTLADAAGQQIALYLAHGVTRIR